MQDRESVVLPRQPDHTSRALMAKLSIAKVLEFTSQTLRSGVVVWSDDGPKGSALLFLRGAPAVIWNMVQAASVPDNFNQVSRCSTYRSMTCLCQLQSQGCLVSLSCIRQHDCNYMVTLSCSNPHWLLLVGRMAKLMCPLCISST